MIARFYHFEPFVKRRPNGLQSVVAAKKSKEFKTYFKFKVKNPRFKGVICTSNLWILRCAQYDKASQYDKFGYFWIVVQGISLVCDDTQARVHKRQNLQRLKNQIL